MNPRKEYSEADTVTARALIQLFVEYGDYFQFAIDGGVSEDEELRAYLILDDHQENDGDSSLVITGINQTENVEELKDITESMGLNILLEDEVERVDEEIGEYTANTFTATAPGDIDADWNVPTLLIYGSLSPELEEACYDAFGSKFNYHNIRNHAVVRGEDLTETHQTELHDVVGRSTQFFDDDKRHVQSSISTADFV